MKNLLLTALIAVSFSKEITAQVQKAMPPDADEFYNKSMPLLRPQVKQLVLQTAASLKHKTINGDSLTNSLRKNSLLKGMSNNDMEGITVLIMVQASKDADDDLKKMVMEISRSANVNNNVNNETDLQNLKLQMIINCKSNIAEEIGYIMKKVYSPQQ